MITIVENGETQIPKLSCIEFIAPFYVVGMEAVGVVTAVGAGLTGRQVGDLVAYAGQPMGSYAEEQILPANKVVPVPSSIDPPIAASIMLKGMTTHFLVRRCFKVIFYDVIVLVAEAILLLSLSFLIVLI